MEEREFNNNLDNVEFIKKQVATTFTEVKASINENLVTSINSLLTLYQSREKDFKEYLELLKEFNYSDNLLSPTDIFPGIRTISDTVNMEELNTKTQKMKELAGNINSKTDQIDSLQNMTILSLKKAISNLSDLIIKETQINDMNMDIVKDLDSIYDIGYLKRATK